jgi:hypothetical protein
VDRVSVTMPPEVPKAVRDAAAKAGLAKGAASRRGVTAVLGAGALIAVDRRDRRIGAMLRVLQRDGVPLHPSRCWPSRTTPC